MNHDPSPEAISATANTDATANTGPITSTGPTTNAHATADGTAEATAATDPDERRLREAFTEAAYGLTPPPVPLAAIERDGRRRRRRRRATMVGVGVGLLLTPVALLSLRPASSDGPAERVVPPAATSPTPSPPSSSPSSPPPSPPSPPVSRARVVASGERVTAADGTKVWLTEKGKFWQSPDETDPEPRFRSVVDGNLDLSTPGVTLQEEGRGEDYFLSGIYHGKGEGARVVITTTTGRKIDGTVLRLAGDHRWGVWYATTKAPASVPQSETFPSGVTAKVTVYDAAGEVVAETDFVP